MSIRFSIFWILGLAAILWAVMTPIANAAVSQFPRYRIVPLKAPKGWERLNLQGITDTGIVFGSVERGQDANHVLTVPFTFSKKGFKIGPNTPNVWGGGVTVDVRAVSPNGKVMAFDRTHVCDGAWMAMKIESYQECHTFTGYLPEPKDKVETDISNCRMAADESVYADVSTTAQPNNDGDDPDKRPHRVGVWKSGKLVQLYEGALIGIDSGGTVYINGPESVPSVIRDNAVAPLNLAENETVSAITPSGWVVKETKISSSESSFAVSNGRTKYTTRFTPEDITPNGIIVGVQAVGIHEDDHAVMQVAGKVRLLDSLVSNLPRTYLLTDAYRINRNGWILAKAARRSDGTMEHDVLLEPIR